MASSASDGNTLDIEVIFIAIGVSAVVAVAMVMCSLVIICFKRYRGKYRPSKIPSNEYPLRSVHGSYDPDDLDYYDPANDDVFTERSDVKDVGEMPREYSKTEFEFDRQIGIPFDDVFSDMGSMARFPFYDEDQLSQRPYDLIVNISLSPASSISDLSGLWLTSSSHAKTSMTRTVVSHRTRTTGSQLHSLSSYQDRHFESRHPRPSSRHDRTSRSPSPILSSRHSRRTSRSLSSIPSSRHDRTSRSLSPILSSRHNRRTSRSLSPIPSSRHDRTSRSLSPIPSSRHDRRSPSLWYHDRMSEEQGK